MRQRAHGSSSEPSKAEARGTTKNVRRARDFVQKPWENARVLTIVRTQVELAPRYAG